MAPLDLFPEGTWVGADGRLWLGGCLAHELAAAYGTPLYVFDEATLAARCREVRAAFASYPGEARVAYASKAFLCLGLAQLMAREGLGLDVVSAGELALARAAGFPPERIHLHGNNKSKFGFTLPSGEAAAALRRALATPGLEVTGLHAHIGSQVFEPEPFARTAEALLDLAAEVGFVPRQISTGGGWGVATGPGEEDVALRAFGEAIAQAVSERCARDGRPLPALAVELGRAIVAPAGVALYTAGARKEIPGVRTYVAVDGGMGDNIRPALYGARYTALAAGAALDPAVETVTLAGRYCESGDVIACDVPLPRLQPGDLVAVPRAGACCLPMASNYNLVPRPAVVLVGDGRARLLQRRETVQDLLARDLPLDDPARLRST